MSDPDDTATRVHRLAVPTSVTFFARREADSAGSGEHYLVTGRTPAGERAFLDQTVRADEDTDSASEAVAVALGRLRERGW